MCFHSLHINKGSESSSKEAAVFLHQPRTTNQTLQIRQPVNN